MPIAAEDARAWGAICAVRRAVFAQPALPEDLGADLVRRLADYGPPVAEAARPMPPSAPTPDPTPHPVEPPALIAPEWLRRLRPAVADNMLLVLGAFLLVAGAVYSASTAWTTMTGAVRLLVLEGGVLALGVMIAATGQRFGRDPVLRTFATVCDQAAASLAPLAAVLAGRLWSQAIPTPIAISIAASAVALAGAAVAIARLGGDRRARLAHAGLALVALVAPLADGAPLAFAIVLAAAVFAATRGTTSQLVHAGVGAVAAAGHLAVTEWSIAPLGVGMAAGALALVWRLRARPVSSVIALALAAGAIAPAAVEPTALLIVALLGSATIGLVSLRRPAPRLLVASLALLLVAYVLLPAPLRAAAMAVRDAFAVGLGYSNEPLPLSWYGVTCLPYVALVGAIAHRLRVAGREAHARIAIGWLLFAAVGLCKLSIWGGVDLRAPAVVLVTEGAVLVGLGVWLRARALVITGPIAIAGGAIAAAAWAEVGIGLALLIVEAAMAVVSLAASVSAAKRGLRAALWWACGLSTVVAAVAVVVSERWPPSSTGALGIAIAAAIVAARARWTRQTWVALGATVLLYRAALVVGDAWSLAAAAAAGAIAVTLVRVARRRGLGPARGAAGFVSGLGALLVVGAAVGFSAISASPGAALTSTPWIVGVAASAALLWLAGVVLHRASATGAGVVIAAAAVGLGIARAAPELWLTDLLLTDLLLTDLLLTDLLLTDLLLTDLLLTDLLLTDLVLTDIIGLALAVTAAAAIGLRPLFGRSSRGRRYVAPPFEAAGSALLIVALAGAWAAWGTGNGDFAISASIAGLVAVAAAALPRDSRHPTLARIAATVVLSVPPLLLLLLADREAEGPALALGALALAALAVAHERGSMLLAHARPRAGTAALLVATAAAIATVASFPLTSLLIRAGAFVAIAISARVTARRHPRWATTLLVAGLCALLWGPIAHDAFGIPWSLWSVTCVATAVALPSLADVPALRLHRLTTFILAGLIALAASVPAWAMVAWVEVAAPPPDALAVLLDPLAFVALGIGLVAAAARTAPPSLRASWTCVAAVPLLHLLSPGRPDIALAALAIVAAASRAGTTSLFIAAFAVVATHGEWRDPTTAIALSVLIGVPLASLWRRGQGGYGEAALYVAALALLGWLVVVVPQRGGHPAEILPLAALLIAGLAAVAAALGPVVGRHFAAPLRDDLAARADRAMGLLAVCALTAMAANLVVRGHIAAPAVVAAAGVAGLGLVATVARLRWPRRGGAWLECGLVAVALTHAFVARRTDWLALLDGHHLLAWSAVGFAIVVVGASRRLERYAVAMPIAALIATAGDHEAGAIAAFTASAVYLVAGYRRRAPNATRIGLALANAGLFRMWIALGVVDPAFFAVPLGATLLLAARLERERERVGRRRAETLQLVGLAVAYLPIAMQVLRVDAPSHALVLFALALGTVAVGARWHRGDILVVGAATVALDVVLYLVGRGFARDFVGAGLLFAAGIAVLAAAIARARRRGRSGSRGEAPEDTHVASGVGGGVERNRPMA